MLVYSKYFNKYVNNINKNVAVLQDFFFCSKKKNKPKTSCPKATF